MNVTLALKVAPWWFGTFLETIYISNMKASHALLIWSELHSNKSSLASFSEREFYVSMIKSWKDMDGQLVSLEWKLVTDGKK